MSTTLDLAYRLSGVGPRPLSVLGAVLHAGYAARLTGSGYLGHTLIVTAAPNHDQRIRGVIAGVKPD